MLGDTLDMAGRIRALLPSRWFGDTTPTLDAVLDALGSAWSGVYALVQTVRQEARIGTATGDFLDQASEDFFGFLPRWPGELDDAFRVRIGQEMLRPCGTRAALTLALSELTGTLPAIFEPARSTDTGGYGVGGVGYAAGGGWGNLSLPYQGFVVVRRPQPPGIALVAGYGTGGALSYCNQNNLNVGPTDDVIYQTVARVMPAATIAWVRIVD